MMNAQKKGMMVICGNSVAELEKELEMLKLAISTGATMGCGGATLGETEKALSALKSAMGDTSPIVEDCGCECCGCCNCEDDEEEICPNCGDILDEDGDCYTCGYHYEDEEPTPSTLLHILMECLENRGERTKSIGALLDLLDNMM